jgi:hypothetical protein
MIFNGVHWGLADEELRETLIGAASDWKIPVERTRNRGRLVS